MAHCNIGVKDSGDCSMATGAIADVGMPGRLITRLPMAALQIPPWAVWTCRSAGVVVKPHKQYFAAQKSGCHSLRRCRRHLSGWPDWLQLAALWMIAVMLVLAVCFLQVAVARVRWIQHQQWSMDGFGSAKKPKGFGSTKKPMTLTDIDKSEVCFVVCPRW